MALVSSLPLRVVGPLYDKWLEAIAMLVVLGHVVSNSV